MTQHQIKVPGTNTLLKFLQKGLPVSQEALFLLEFINVTGFSPRKEAIDIGCGSGVLSAGLATLFPEITVRGYELQQELVDTARFNCAENNLSHRVEIIHGDVRDKIIRPTQHCCDFVITNPPFRRQDSGRISPDKLKQSANHELAASLEEFIYIGAVALSHKGFMGMVMIPERLSETMMLMDKYRVPSIAVQWIHHTRNAPASAFLVIGRKGGRGGMKVLSPVFVK